MPADIFYRLSHVKQQLITDAIKNEVTRAPYEEFSIYNVVQQCSISRGSFYQYFANKEDIFLYLLSDYNRGMIEKFIYSLKEHNGDFFIAIEESFRFGIRMFCYKESKIYRQHLFCNVTFYEKIWMDDDFSAEKYPVLGEAFALINRDKLNLSKEQDLMTLLQICMSFFTRECITLLLTNAHEEDACETFMKKLDFLKQAYYKN